jgi:hypothetical protein
MTKARKAETFRGARRSAWRREQKVWRLGSVIVGSGTRGDRPPFYLTHQSLGALARACIGR